MGESRDANDPRDLLRAMNKEARREFEEAEQSDTGGQEHASRAERDRSPARGRDDGALGAGAERATRAQPDAGRPRTPGGDQATGGAQRTAGGTDEGG